MSGTVVIDTNLLVRFLLTDHPTQSAAVRSWFERSRRRRTQLIILPTVLTELVTVLRLSRPPLTHQAIVSALDTVLGMAFTIVDRAIIQKAWELYRDLHARDWEDCLIAAYSMAIADGHLATYDQKLSRIPGLVPFQP